VSGEVAKFKKKRRRVVTSISPRMDLWLDGELDPSDFTDEEVQRMQLSDKDGSFRGRPPMAIPRELAMAFRAEAQKRLQNWFVEIVPDAQRAYKELLNSRHLAPGDAARLRAAEGVFERVIGKVVAQTDMHVVMDKGKTFEDFVGEAIIDVEEEDA
jgi:hypothetical protein